MKLMVTTLAALGLAAAPAMAQQIETPKISQQQTAAVSQTTSDDDLAALATVPVLGVPAGLLALGGVVIVGGAVAVAASNSSNGTN
ncbi:MAG: hypothetical protein VYD87_20180 [Pseudomonadota bacterium]|nr:hypothetical protein [Pseudomonadota bacterium]MEE3099249.1 hypothetical protein [Pseudomonadota bacterium]